MKRPLLFLATLLPLTAQEADPNPPTEEEAAPLVAKPSRDLYDLATLYYNSATEEKEEDKKRANFFLAAKKFTQFLKAYPSDPKALNSWFFLGQCHRNIGKEKESRECFEAVAKNWTKGKFVAASALYLASDDYKNEEWKLAAKWFEIVAKTTETDQVRHESLYRRFLCFRNLKDKPNMLRSLKAVIDDPKNPFIESARLALARLYQNTQSQRQAHEQYVLLARSKKADLRAEATLQAALTAQELKDTPLAKTWFAKVLKEPGAKKYHGQTQLALMNLYFKDEDWKSVLKIFEIGSPRLEKKEQLQRLIMATKAHEALGHDDKVLKLYEQISKLSPGTANSFQAAYRVLVRDHQKKARNFPRSAEAFLKNYSTANSKDPKIHSARLLLAEHYFDRKEYKRALQHYRDLDLNLVDKANQLGVRYHVAKTQIALKDNKGALAAIGTFINQFPTSRQALQLRLDRAEILTKLGREKEALADYQKVLASEPDAKIQRTLLLRLAATHQENKDWDQLAATQLKILKLPKLDQKTEASAHFWLGWNHARLKENEKAVPLLRKARDLDSKTYTSKVGPILVRSAYQAEDTELLEKELNLLRISDSQADIPSAIPRWLGATLARDAHYERAWPFLSEGLRDDDPPAAPLIWKLYTKSALATNRYQPALEAANSLLEKEKSAYRKAEAHFFRARAFLGLKNYNDARQATSDALDLRPEGELDVLLRLFAGDIDIAEGKPADALRHFTVVDSLYAKTADHKKEAREKVISTLKAIGTPEAQEQLKNYEK